MRYARGMRSSEKSCSAGILIEKQFNDDPRLDASIRSLRRAVLQCQNFFNRGRGVAGRRHPLATASGSAMPEFFQSRPRCCGSPASARYRERFCNARIFSIEAEVLRVAGIRSLPRAVLQCQNFFNREPRCSGSLASARYRERFCNARIFSMESRGVAGRWHPLATASGSAMPEFFQSRAEVLRVASIRSLPRAVLQRLITRRSGGVR